MVNTYLDVLRVEFCPAEVILSQLPAVELVESACVIVGEGVDVVLVRWRAGRGHRSSPSQVADFIVDY